MTNVFAHVQDPQLVAAIARLFFWLVIPFSISILLTPALTHVLYKYRLGKRIREGGAPVFTKLHKKKEGTPTMGGILIWLTVAALGLFMKALAVLAPDVEVFASLAFLNHPATWMLLIVMLLAAALGVVDDIMNIFKIGPKGGGLRMKHRLLLYVSVAIVAAVWMYAGLDITSMHIPGFGSVHLGWTALIVFSFVIVATAFSANEADGLDGLAGGMLLAAFAAYAAIAYARGQIDIAAFAIAIIGGLLSFLWFNIHPARFFMGDTGSMSLGVALGVIAILTDSILVLPIIALPLVLESLTVIVQMTYKKITGGKKIWHSTPIHHHFEAIGWPETKITMRAWILAAMSAALGLLIGIVAMG